MIIGYYRFIVTHAFIISQPGVKSPLANLPKFYLHVLEHHAPVLKHGVL
jgi:hypothetical protein